MAERHDDAIGLDGLAVPSTTPVMCFSPPRSCRRMSVDPLLEADFAAERDDLGPHVLDHRDEAEGADVGFRDEEDFLGRASLDEFLQDLAAEMARILDLRIEFAVRERACAAFAELCVGVRVQLALAPEPERVDRSLAYDLAAFEDDRVEAHLGEDQAREQAARAEADDDGAPSCSVARLRAACRRGRASGRSACPWRGVSGPRPVFYLGSQWCRSAGWREGLRA